MKFTWDTSLYDEKHDFVFKFGEDVVNLLNPQRDENILDLGCGTGDLTKKISDSAKMVVGLDNSLEMIQAAQRKYPEITFFNSDGKDFHIDCVFDAVFSNAVLHWIPEADKVVKNINKHLKIDGRFVAEFGGKGCVNKIISTLKSILDNERISYPKIDDMLYYPSIGQYSILLEKLGFEVNFAVLFNRPTELKGGVDGLNNFIEMFLNWLFVNISANEKSRIIKIANDRLKSEMFNGAAWIADYRRIRIVAYKNITIE
jgi:ubiquinone/menaquinone biosynthesis C-methylase UbiE